MTALTMFSFGYWGWGNSTAQLVKAVDAVEHARGFKTPLGVDIGLKRTVRAAGFSGNQFADMTGERHYRWVPELGNANIEDTTATRIKIKVPATADVLLDLALEEAHSSRRVIFFCACALIQHCHRRNVAALLLSRAEKRQVALRIEEWPGGEPGIIELRRNEDDVNRLRRGIKSIALDPRIRLY